MTWNVCLAADHVARPVAERMMHEQTAPSPDIPHTEEEDEEASREAAAAVGEKLPAGCLCKRLKRASLEF
jgi:hypothetical protein